MLNACCQLQGVATEYVCQGLGLNLPIACWEDDLLWSQERWRSLPQPRSKAHNPHRLRLHSYRVLLSRGRDGVMVFVSPELGLDGTYQALVSAGMHRLKDS